MIAREESTATNQYIGGAEDITISSRILPEMSGSIRSVLSIKQN